MVNICSSQRIVWISLTCLDDSVDPSTFGSMQSASIKMIRLRRQTSVTYVRNIQKSHSSQRLARHAFPWR
ncbi:hypothetical protein PSPO01_03676 [Paraphaeosphaeria sporulosa]